MNKAEIIDDLAKSTGQSKTEAEGFLDSFMKVVTKTIGDGQGVKIVGFGSFNCVERKARVGRNPQTGVEVPIPARRVPLFKPGKELKELIINSKED